MVGGCTMLLWRMVRSESQNTITLIELTFEKVKLMCFKQPPFTSISSDIANRPQQNDIKTLAIG